jgi:hypothetical protein
MSVNLRRAFFALGAGLAAMLALLAVSTAAIWLAQPSGDALDQVWQNKVNWLPFAIAFGTQVGLYTLLGRGVHLPWRAPAAKATTATGGGASTLAMIACCAPAGLNLLPLLGLTAVTAFFAQWRMPFMVLALAANGIGIAFMLYSLLKQRRQAAPPVACHAG